MSSPTPIPLSSFAQVASRMASDGMDIVLSGSAITFGQPGALGTPTTYLEVYLTNLTFRFEFVSDGGERRFLGTPTGVNHYTLKFFNFKDPLPAGFIKPMSVGTLGGRPLFLNLAALSIADGAPLIVYFTFYAGAVGASAQ